MKVRKLAVALALAGGLGSGVAQALGLGEIELQSYLNEPLDAEITLRKSGGVDPGDVFVNIASDSAYERVGIDRNYFLTKLNFNVTTAPDGSLVVNVSSREPLREPYLNFLLEVTWPSGRLMREYAVLVDPPVYAEESGVEEEISAPATRQASQPSQQQAQPESRARQQEPQRTVTQRARTFGPTGPSDTLWNIATSVRPDGSVSTQQVMLALQDLNPDAFIGGNINRLKRGEVLRVPDIEDIRSRSRAEATRQVAAQNEAFTAPQRPVDATDDSAETGVASGQGQTGGDELRLLAGDESSARDTDEGGSAGGDGDTAGGVDAGSAVAMEELESARRENEELSGRVDDLQNQVETLQRLLELKNTQLAEIQQAEGEAGDAQPADAPGEETVAEQVADEDVEAETDLAAADTEDADAAEPEAGEAAPVDEEQVASAEGEEADAEAGDVAMEEDTGMADQDSAMDESETAATPADDEDREEEAEVAAPAAEQPGQEPATPPAQPDKGFPDNVISAITNNPMYQIALGGGLVVLLLLLLLLARRNANREKAFYDQLNGETEGETDTFDLTLDDEEGAETPGDDPLAEADAYIAYGRMDQAAQSLETAISREPSRTDLRLKLLGVYADTQDRGSFEKQLGEVETLDDEEAIAEAYELRSRLEEAESMPSIDDLESQLRSDSFDTSSESPEEPAGAAEEDSLSDEFASDRYESRPEEEDEDEFGSLETDFSELDLDEQEEAEAAKESSPDDLIEYDLSDIDTSTSELEETGADEAGSKPQESEDDAFDFTLEDDSGKEGDEDDLGLELDDVEGDTATGETEEAAEADDDSDEFASLELDEEDLESTGTETPVTTEAESEGDEVEDGDLDSLDESFLDELDAELDKVASDDEVPADSDQNELDDLELDVSDEDLALMEEFADSGDSAGVDAEEDSKPLDEELGLEDALSGEEPSDPEEAVAGAEAVEEELPELGEDAEEEPPVASDTEAAGASKSPDLDESDLGDDDDFDFLSGTDEASTKLDLARAYVEMGDVDGARDILEEVALEGDEEQKAEAKDLLKNLS